MGRSLAHRTPTSVPVPVLRPHFAGSAWELTFLLLAAGLWCASWWVAPLNTFAVVWLSILLEALPFMLLGSLVGGWIETMVSPERLAAWLPKKTWQTVLLAAGLGVVFPICECAVVPVVRRLARKGVPLGAVVAFLLGGPIVNPIVAASTVLAYSGNLNMMGLRMGTGYVLAVTIGLLLTWLFENEQAFLPAVFKSHEHGSECAGGCSHGAASLSGREKVRHVFQHASDDFLEAGRFLILGAFVAALVNTFVPRQALTSLVGIPGLAILAMMLFAVLVNLCSEADAFVAASLQSWVPLPAQLAFLVLGPMLDIKLLMMYQTLFKPKTIALLAGLILACVFAVTFIMSLGGL